MTEVPSLLGRNRVSAPPANNPTALHHRFPPATELLVSRAVTAIRGFHREQKLPAEVFDGGSFGRVGQFVGEHDATASTASDADRPTTRNPEWHRGSRQRHRGPARP